MIKLCVSSPFKTFFYRLSFASLLLAGLMACSSKVSTVEQVIEQSASTPPIRPNILWLVTEDMGNYIAPFGDNTVATPTLSRLAEEGIRYTNVFSPSGVCAPSRAALAMGMYPSSFGANHMRTGSNTDITGLPKYEAVPPAEAKMLSQYMRANGYYTSNNYKTDYQFKAPKTAWHESGPYAHWRNRPANTPFFSIFNFTVTHESGLFEPYGFRHIEERHYFSDDAQRIAQLPKGNMSESESRIHIDRDTNFSIPPYLPQTDIVKRDMWKLYNNIAEMDKQVASVLKQLKEDGLLENTIIFFYGDHGGPLPRQKRLIYDSGLKVPLIIRYPQAQKAGAIDDQLISFVDFPSTVMGLAGINLPSHLHGRDFIANTTPKREYIHAAADRFDGFTDAIRAVRNKRFKYIRNYRPEQPYYLPVVYRERIPTMKELLRLHKEGKLTDVQAQWFRGKKDKEELFDLKQDPHELKNLAALPQYQGTLNTLRAEMDSWLTNINDTPNLPERELINRLWQGANTQPLTVDPVVQFEKGKAIITSSTNGASIGYKIIESGQEPKQWLLYKNPIEVKSNDVLKVQAHRIGYTQSAIVTAKNNH